MLGNMVERGVLDRTSAELIGAAVSEKSLAAVPRELRDAVRAMIYKNMLLVTRR
jgi:transcriptional regulator CtsR